MVREAAGCALEATAVSLTASAGTLAGTATTDILGEFQADFTAPAEAGPVTITARVPPLTSTASIRVTPVLDTIAPFHGDMAGGTEVTITGRGFVNNATIVNFGANNPAAPQVQSSTHLTTVVPPSHSPNTGDVSVSMSVRGVQAQMPGSFTYIVPFGPFLRFSNAGCGSATLSALIFDHLGNPVAGEPVTLTATTGQFLSGSTLSSTVTLNANASGEVTAKMVTAAALPNDLAASGHTAHRPSPDETGSTKVISKALCHRLSGFRFQPRPVQVGEQLIPTILDGCHACSEESRFRLEWHAKAAALKWITVVGLTNDATLGSNLSVAVVGAEEGTQVLKQAPAPGEVVTLLALKGALDNGQIDLHLKVKQNEKLTVYQLQENRWNRVDTRSLPSGSLSARIKTAGTFAVIAAR